MTFDKGVTDDDIRVIPDTVEGDLVSVDSMATEL